MNWIKKKIEIEGLGISQQEIADRLYPEKKKISAASSLSRKLTGDVAWKRSELVDLIEIIDQISHEMHGKAKALGEISRELLGDIKEKLNQNEKIAA